MRVVVWVVEGTWQGCVDTAREHFPSDTDFALLHVTPSDVNEAAEAASIGLFGRGIPRQSGRSFDDIADDAASQLLAAAAIRLGRSDVELLSRRGRIEREVVSVAAENVDVLVLARDGDHERLGPRSLGHATRFVVDHCPCAVLLVWPDEPPGIDSIPPPKHEHVPKHDRPPKRGRPPKHEFPPHARAPEDL